MAIPTSHGTMIEELADRIETVLKPTLPAGVVLQYPNQKYEPNIDTWIRISFMTGGNFQADFGAPSNKRFRQVGILQFAVFHKLGRGTTVQSAIVDLINTAFRSKKVNGVLYKTPDIKTIGRDGEYWQVNVDCQFWVDVHGS